MKPNWFMVVLSLCIAVLAGYGLYSANAESPNVWLITIFGAISIYSSLLGMAGFRFEREGHTVNVRLVSFFFLIAFVADNIVFSVIGVYIAPYIILTGFLLLVYASLAYKMINTKV